MTNFSRTAAGHGQSAIAWEAANQPTIKQQIKDKLDALQTTKEEIKTFLYSQENLAKQLQDKNAKFILFYTTKIINQKQSIIENLESDFNSYCALVEQSKNYSNEDLIALNDFLANELLLMKEEFELMQIKNG